MAECSKCGKQTMSFECRYCGKKIGSEHRLPENHDCENLEESIEKEKDKSGKGVTEKEEKNPAPSEKRRTATSQKPTFPNEIKRTLTHNYTLAIITVTVLSFFVQQLFPFYENLLVLSPALTEAALQATNSGAGGNLLTSTLLQQPWTLLTVVLAHGSMFHLFANMVTFYFFGTPTERLIGSKRLLKFYIGSALAASIGYILFRNILFYAYGPMVNGLPTLSPAVGASGAVVATFAVVAMLYPKAEVLLYFFIPMKIKTALYIFAGVEGINMLAKTAGIYLPVIGGFASSAHLVGMLVGIWYGKRLQGEYAQRSSVFNPLGV